MILVVRDWFMGRAERERWLIAAMLAIALPLLIYLLVYAPLERALGESRERHIAAVQLNARTKAQLAQLEESRSLPGTPAVSDLALLVGESAGRSGITVASTEPRGAGVAVSLAGASSTSALRWLQELEAQGAVVTDMQVTPAPDGTLAITAKLGRRGNW